MKNRYRITYGLVVTGLFLSLWGCGKTDSITAPSGSTITVNPSSVSITGPISGDVIQNFRVSIKDKIGNPLNNAQLFIFGMAAAPRTPTRYQFYREVNANTAVDSGYTASTNSFGVYEFSIKIPASVNGSSNSVTDQIEISSGDAFVSVTVTLS